MRILALANQKGGVGKTTTAVNLSVFLARRGWRVLLIDLDPQANATSSLGHTPANGTSLYRPLVGEATASQLIVPTTRPNLSLIQADLDLAGVEIEVARQENHLFRVREVLAPLKAENRFDFAILDCPPSLGILMTNALVAADDLIIPLQCEYFALEGLARILRVSEMLRGGLPGSGANSVAGIVMTMFDLRTNLSQQVLAEVRQHFGSKIFNTVIPRTVRLAEAPSFGQSIAEYDPSSSGATAYNNLSAEVLARLGYPASVTSNQ